MGDIHMGDAHLIALDDCASEENDSPFDHYVALIVAQHRNNFDFSALDSGTSMVTNMKDFNQRKHVVLLALKALGNSAKELKASVHLPRIGAGSRGKYNHVVICMDLFDFVG